MSVEEPEQKGQSIEQTLICEFQLNVIKPPQSFELPENLNFSALEEVGIGEEDARDLAQSIKNYENLPTIIDQFNQDHTARREWRKQIETQYGNAALSFLKSNKLRVNSFSFINYLFAKVDLHIRKSTPSELLLEKINSIRQKYGKIVEGYGEMEVSEKIEAVKKLDNLFIEIIELLRVERP